MGENDFKVGFIQQVKPFSRQPQAFRTQLNLVYRFLAGDIGDLLRRIGYGCRDLQEQGGFADTRRTAGEYRAYASCDMTTSTVGWSMYGYEICVSEMTTWARQAPPLASGP